jgi:DNA-binding CsgD family transcriptional regulator
MPRLKHFELQALSSTLLELYSPSPQANLPARFFAALKRHLSCDNYCYSEFSNQGAACMAFEPALRVDTNVFNHYVDQHPTIAAFIKDQIRSSLKISDFLSLNQWRRSDLWNNCFRLENLNYQLGYLALNPGPRLGLALNRTKRDFTDGERALFDLLIPHLLQVFQTSQLFSRRQDPKEANGQAWLIADSTGQILSETNQALHWLTEYFGHNGSLPARIRDWLRQRAAAFNDSNGLVSPLQDFSIQRGATHLTVRSLSPPDSPEQRLLLSKDHQELHPQPLQSLGLTKREAEVLFWISHGKRNSEIGQILGARTRTIAKHLEKIFVKLGVETRTAAANAALEVLHSSSSGNGSSHSARPRNVLG